jgi:uncharacterized protein (DUF433 family)
MNWRDHIYSNPDIRSGRPIFRGTRIKVDFVLELIAAGWSADQMASEYPEIEPHHPQAAAAFAVELMRDEDYVAIGQAKAA